MASQRNIFALPFKKRKFLEFTEDLPQQISQEHDKFKSCNMETPMIPVDRVKRMKLTRRRLFGPSYSDESTEAETRMDHSEPLDLRTQNPNVSPSSPKSPKTALPEKPVKLSEKSVNVEEKADTNSITFDSALRSILYKRITPHMPLYMLVDVCTKELIECDEHLRISGMKEELELMKAEYNWEW